MSREESVEAVEVGLEVGDFALVEFLVDRRNLGGAYKGLQRGDEQGDVGV